MPCRLVPRRTVGIAQAWAVPLAVVLFAVCCTAVVGVAATPTLPASLRSASGPSRNASSVIGSIQYGSGPTKATQSEDLPGRSSFGSWITEPIVFEADAPDNLFDAATSTCKESLQGIRTDGERESARVPWNCRRQAHALLTAVAHRRQSTGAASHILPACTLRLWKPVPREGAGGVLGGLVGS